MCSTCGCSEHTHVRIHQLHPPDAARKAHSHSPSSTDEHGHGDHPHTHAHQHIDEAGGLGAPPTARIVRLEQDILANNAMIAARNRGWFEGRRVLTINLMGSPGAGKTSLLERTVREFGGVRPILVVEGDQETTRDAARITQAGARAIQITTGSGCHLDAAMLSAAIQKLDPPMSSLLLIENVGNLVCPALFDLGEAARIVVMSTTEGEDKPLKYPNMFRFADIVVLNKVDLLPYLDFNVDECIRYARQVNFKLDIFQLSATTGDGLQEWYAWLRTKMEELSI
jgi:hydrogenase nickel incorporation protein HypB